MIAPIDRIARCVLAVVVLGGCGDNLARHADAAVDAAPDASDGRSIPLVPNPSASTCGAPDSATLQHAVVAKGHCAWLFATGLGNPRGLYVDPSGDALVVTTVGGGQVVALYDDDGDRVSGPNERAVLVPGSMALGLNHGIWVHDGYLYASSMTTVYRWPYTSGQRTPLGTPEVVVQNLPSGGHVTRTLVAQDGDTWLYVSVGSGSNMDPNPDRAKVMRYDLTAIPAGGYDWAAGEVFAEGFRNEVGLAFDPTGRLWGVQNGMDDIERSDINADIHTDNPAEQVNLLDQPGRFYGYPYCWTEFSLPQGVGLGPGTQWATEATRMDGTHDDAWCRNPANVTPPQHAMLAHQAPLGIAFYQGANLSPLVDGDAFVALHGSWDRDPPAGYKLVRLIFDDPSHIARDEPFLQFEGPGDTGMAWPHRPVDVKVAKDGALLVTSDASGVVIAIAKQSGT